METMTDRIMAVAKTMGMNKMAEVERFCGIPVRTLTNMASGHKPKEATLQKICEALGISKEYILGEDGCTIQVAPPVTASTRRIPPKQDRLRQFAKLLASMNDRELDTVIEYMTFLKSRKG